MPTDERETTSTLVREGDTAVVLDAGTGVRRLALDRSLLDGITRVHICLTHFHLDHVIGLSYAGELGVPVEVWGGGAALEATPTVEIVSRLLASPFSGPVPFEAIHELREGEQQVGPFRVRARKQPQHSNPTLALRLGGLVCCTDTAYDEANVEFARGARVLLHEAFVTADTSDDPSHTAAGEAARLAAAAGVERLVLIHLNPLEAREDDLLAYARPHFPATEVGRDGLELSI
jgi:ribonuclease BN (tRNA processing enzyme)